MIYLVAGLALFAIAVLGAKWAAYANPGQLVQLVFRIGALVVVAIAGVLALRGQWFLALPLVAMAWGMFRKKPASAGADTSRGRGSTVRTAALEMTLDHDTGIIIGRVLAGHLEGRELDGLSEAELASLWTEIASDRESRDLLEAYLDSRRSDWRDAFDADTTTGEAGTTDTGPMTKEEAYQILGLSAGAGEAEIVSAHRRLMKRVHPDQGGSTFLAAKINAAKAVLLGKHG